MQLGSLDFSTSVLQLVLPQTRPDRYLDTVWYGSHPLALVLSPLAWLYAGASVLRRQAYRYGWLGSQRFPVPVLVVGNITVGGTGKTPLVIWLTEFLGRHGYTPGVVCRGHGGAEQAWPVHVTEHSDPVAVGDEPVVVARRTGYPVVAGPDRVADVRELLESTDCDVVISDDGLQHYALGRDVEIAVVDGSRGEGNGRCLPAGPLREPVSRLASVDLVVANQKARPGEIEMGLRVSEPRGVVDDRPGSFEELQKGPVHGVCGIGNPARFFSSLMGQGLSVVEQVFADHHPFRASDLDFDDTLPVVMTEKDAVKCRGFAKPNHWYVPVTAVLPEPFGSAVLERLTGPRSTRPGVCA
jgi:tetraacyldisaccharide 4'-kinase